ncbi:Hypothetical predicted protein [Paramuricea clavata]|uniref:Uncharacterized protein n=1 Tax=Paramuricea clavata TaxID=317549 RepID=A0A7D9HD32_PARCT|nr:Hypothetical predicted protein [Paramuricea clavata]
MTFVGDVGSTLTEGMREDKTVSAKKEIMIIRNTQFVANIEESVKVRGVDKGTGCLKRRVPGVVTEGVDNGLQMARVDCFTLETVMAFVLVLCAKNAIYSSARSDAVEGWVVAR